MSRTTKRQTLASFGRASLALTEFLKRAEPLDIEDQIFIENHLVIVRLAYSTWRRGQHDNRSHQSGTRVVVKDTHQDAA